MHRPRPLGHRHRPPPAQAATRPHRRAGVPRRPTRPSLRTPRARRRDTCPATGRGKLSYPRAEYLFK